MATVSGLTISFQDWSVTIDTIVKRVAAATRARRAAGRAVMALTAVVAICSTPARAQSGAPVPPGAPAAGLGEWRKMGNGGFMMRLVGDPSKPEWFAFRVRYPADMMTDSAPHFHLGTEHVTVLSGTLVLGLGDHVDLNKVVQYGPGSFVVIAAGVHHYEWFRGEVVSHVEGFGPMETVWVNRPDSARASVAEPH
jgi:hypothetical protein